MLKRICIALLIFFLLFPCLPAAYSDNLQVRSRITEIEDIVRDGLEEQIITVNILEGQHVNQRLEIKYAPLFAARRLDLRIGQKVIIGLHEDGGQLNGYIINIDRTEHLIQLTLIFFFVVLVFGGVKGLLSLISLGFSGFIIIKIIIPLIINGYDPIFVSVASSIFIILISFLLIGGFTKKSFTAIISTSAGTIVAGLLANYYIHLVSLSGATGEEAMYITTELGLAINFRGLLISGIIIGTIGAIMDVSMSITSCIFEIIQHSPRISFMKLIVSGFNVGKDTMSTMTNTLVLAYAGASMPLFLIFFNSEISVSLISNDIIASEIIRSLSGSIGLVLTIPFTVIFASFMAKNT